MAEKKNKNNINKYYDELIKIQKEKTKLKKQEERIAKKIFKDEKRK